MMAMGMDYAWHESLGEQGGNGPAPRPIESTETDHRFPPDASDGIAGLEGRSNRCKICGVGVIPTGLCVRCSVQEHTDARASHLTAEVTRLREVNEALLHKGLETAVRHQGTVAALQDRVHDLDYRLLSSAALAAKAQDSCSRFQGVAADLQVRVSRLETRLREHIADAIVNVDPRGDDSPQEWQCEMCGDWGPTPADIDHIDGLSPGERTCPVLLDIRAMGLPAMDDSEGVES